MHTHIYLFIYLYERGKSKPLRLQRFYHCNREYEYAHVEELEQDSI